MSVHSFSFTSVTAEKKTYMTEGDWSVIEYIAYPIPSLTHQHGDSEAHTIPFGSTVKENYTCAWCSERAPESLITIWHLLNFDNFSKYTLSDKLYPQVK